MLVYCLGFLPTYIAREIRELRRRGSSVRVLLPDVSPRAAMWDSIAGEADPIPVERAIPWAWLGERTEPRQIVAAPESPAFERYRSRGLSRHFAIAEHLRSTVDLSRASRVHAHFAGDFAEVGVILADLLGVPFSLTTHAKDIFVPRHPSRVAELLAEARPLFTISEFNRSAIRRLAGEAVAAKAIVARAGLDPAALPRRGTPDEPPRIVCSASGLVEKKGVPDLLDACTILARRGLDFSCEIAGADPLAPRLAELEAEIARRRLGRRVQALGLVPNPVLLSHLARAAVFALPCRPTADGDLDGIPVALLEAMGIGLPVVTTAVSGIPEAVASEASGLLVPPRDAEALADALERVLREPQLARSLGEAARRTVGEHFSIAGTVDRLVEAWAA